MKIFKPILFSSLLVFLSLKSSFAFPLIDSIKLNKNIDISKVFQIKCGEKETKIKNRVTNFEEKYNRHMAIYNKLLDRLETKIETWKTAGYDTSKLEEDLDELTKMVDEFTSAYSAYMEKLRNSQSLACGSEGDFKTAIEEAQADLKEIRTMASEIKNFYYNTIRPDILELKQQNLTEEE